LSLKQPVLGIAATAIVIAVSLGFISPFEFPLFAGWVSFALLSIIPMQIVVAVLWGTQVPVVVGETRQPLKGMLLLSLTLLAGCVLGGAYFVVVGGTVSPPTPMLVQCAITSVVVTFFGAIIWGGWPFTSIFSSKVAAGLSMLAACYVINYVLFLIFFNYAFLADAPVYVAALDPQGLFDAWDALIFYMSALGVMFLMLHFDLWPLSGFPALMQQPVLGLVWTAMALILGGFAFYVGVVWLGVDVVRYLVRAPVPFIFGTIVVLNMLQGSTFRRLEQPFKGLASALLAAVIGIVLALGYEAMAPVVTGSVASGPPAYESEIWLASALLGVTFPFLIFYAEFFGFWPLQTKAE
jgi:hypothetical protein